MAAMPIPYREQPPPAALAPWVECLWSVDLPAGTPPYAVPPDGCLDIVYSSDAGLRAIGAMTTERRYDLPATARLCGVRFRPAMAGAFLKTEPARLTDLEVPVCDLWGAPAHSLTGRLDHAVSLADAVSALSAALRPPATAPDPVQRAIAAMAAAHGMVDVDGIAREANLSARQFRRRCLEASGLTPKHLCRVLRFRHARELAVRSPGLKWSLIAADAGYFDQAHLIRDFREFTGRTPAGV